jgi:hypothetical protein
MRLKKHKFKERKKEIKYTLVVQFKVKREGIQKKIVTSIKPKVLMTHSPLHHGGGVNIFQMPLWKTVFSGWKTSHMPTSFS